MIALQAAVLVLLGVALAPSEQSAIDATHEYPVPDIVKNRFINHNLRYKPPPPPPGRGRSLHAVQELYMDQLLDHYNPSDKRTWKQRYYARSDNYQAGGPAFIFIGGEGEEGIAALGDYVLFVTYLAENFGAKTFDLEHRFYGRSHPLPDLTTASLQYLSADQALADLAYFIQYLKDSGDIEEGQPIAVFGGSYPGNLAAWARYKYPHLINAAISSSAPVQAKADFVEYMEVVGKAMKRKAGQWCYDNVKKATDRIVALLKTPTGYQKVRDTFRVASDLTTKPNLDQFFQALSGAFAQAVQYNRDSNPNSDQNVNHVCSQISGTLTPDQAMAKLAHIALGKNDVDGVIYDWSYQGSIRGLQNTAYTTDQNGIYDAGRQWVYQTCSEFGYYQTYTSGATPFPKAYNDVDHSVQICKDVFGASFDKAELTAAVKRSNLIFGGRTPAVSNVYFINGNIDPWHPLGVLKNLSSSSPAFIIDGGSHCADMDYPNWRTDSADITTVHQKVNDFLRKVLYEKPDSDPADY